ncbi:MAG: ABC transporter substrate-binding protein [Proteobacteria bacterium]|nr:ABC transporter substrate-binding protein [Pseudomonadota bacterium]
MRNILTLSIIVAMVCIGFVTGGWTEEPIKVGAVINLTGPASTWGQYHARGHRDYFRHVNDVKKGIGGRKIELTVVDHAYIVPEALRFVKKFCTQDKMDMIATWDAGSGIQAKPLVQKYKTPTINYSTYQGLLKPPLDYMYLPFGSYVLDSHAVLEYIRTTHGVKGNPKVGLLTYNNTYGKSIHEPSKQYAAKHNVDIVGIEEFPTKTIDLTTELLRLKERGAEYVFLQILPAHIVIALRSADRINYGVPFFGTWTATDPDFFVLGKGLIRDRLFMQFSGGLPADNTPGVKLMMEVRKYSRVKTFDTSYWEGVVVAMIMERAFQRANEQSGKINRKTINKAMESFQNEDFGGLVPKVSYSKDNHEGSFVARIVRIHEDATYTPLTNFFVPGKGQIKLK